MKKIIGTKVYNTDTAVELGQYWNGLSTSDFGYVSERLYATKKGAYFLHGEGGAMSHWSEACGNARCGGEGIEPLTELEALAWMSEHGDPDDVCKRFNHLLEEA